MQKERKNKIKEGVVEIGELSIWQIPNLIWSFVSAFFWLNGWMGFHRTKPSGSAMGREGSQVSVNNRIDYISLPLTQKLPSDFALFT